MRERKEKITVTALFDELFGERAVEEIRKKFSSDGLKGLDLKDYLVLIGRHFNDETTSIKGNLHTIALYVKILLPIVTASGVGLFIAYIVK